MTGNDEPIRGQASTSTHHRVSHGLYRPKADWRTTRDDWLAELHSWRLVLPADAVFTHVTAAALRGWWLPVLPESPPIFAAGRIDRRPQRQGLIYSRLGRETEPDVAAGLPLDSPEEVLLRCARDLGELDMVPMVDSALRRGDVSRGRLLELCASRRPGVRMLRKSVLFSDPRAESAWEVLLRIFHELAGIEVEPQVDLFAGGRFLGRADLLVKGTFFVQEYDGAEHRKPARQTSDRRRDRGLAGSPYIRRGYTADDLMNHELAVLAELDSMLGRPHRRGRLSAWRAWKSRSTYTPSGRARIYNRWRLGS